MGWFKRSVMGLFQYETPIALRINSKTLGVIQILLKILILCYVIGYVIVHQKGYQVESPITFAVTTKIKGVIFTNFTIQELGIPEDHAVLYNRIWDPTDYVIPGSGGTHGDFFILTNAVITPNQIRGVCPEEEVLEDARCSIDSDCILGNSHPIGNGVFTGKCVQGPNTIYKTCEVRAWCPVELDKLPLGGKRALLEGSRYSTVLIKNSIEFPLFGNKYKKRNILDSSSVKDLENCIHHVKDDPSCPIFRIGDIVEAAGENFSKVAVKGGVFRIEINWECDLDWDFTKHCNPRYSFERMDIAQSEISPGWNFRKTYTLANMELDGCNQSDFFINGTPYTAESKIPETSDDQLPHTFYDDAALPLYLRITCLILFVVIFTVGTVGNIMVTLVISCSRIKISKL
ncbi:unnamed protein product [Orchesella dallaii]|uniref:ATP receptor n=1 Tax=Orchesella dallaii TaxID=48710 RepID=A0ABP1PQV3_9HEXA